MTTPTFRVVFAALILDDAMPELVTRFHLGELLRRTQPRPGSFQSGSFSILIDVDVVTTHK